MSGTGAGVGAAGTPGIPSPTKNERFLRACRGLPVDAAPVWIMRQAGRFLPEYRALREKHTFWEMCTIPELTTEVTLQPVRRLGVDAAILFSDILVPLAAMGLSIEFHPAPEIRDPIRVAADVDRLRDPSGSPILDRVDDAVRSIRRALDGAVPLIGFAGAPFTVAAYATGGGGSRNHVEMRSLLFGDPEAAHRLLRRITDAAVVSLERQIAAGAQAVQLFDSWAGILSPEDYEAFALPYAREVLERVRRDGVPRIYFAPGAMGALERIATVGADVIGIDWRISLAEARKVLQDRFALQGNLDPGILLGRPETIVARTREILEQARGLKGHVLNLGHGILPETPVENAQAFVEAAHAASSAGGAARNPGGAAAGPPAGRGEKEAGRPEGRSR